MAVLRSTNQNTYNVGNIPPQVVWTLVRGDTASFKVFVTDDTKVPLVLEDWTIKMEVKRPNNANELGVITDDAEIILTLTPEHDADDLDGEFTVFVSADQSAILETGDIFDIELSTEGRNLVWTVAQGSVSVIEDVTN
jgi:hypothetical protein